MEKKIDKLSKYVDPTGEFTNRELKWAEWYLKHKLLLQKIGKNVLIAWCAVTVGYSLSYWVYYLSYGYFQDQNTLNRQVVEFQNYQNLQVLYSAKPLQIGNIEVYNSVSNLYDFVARTTNPNDRWLAKLTYKFTYAGGETETRTEVLWPGTSRPVAVFGVPAGAYPGYPNFVIEKIEWEHFNPHEMQDVKGFIAVHSMFTTENFVFTSASRSAGILNHIIQFDLYNDSAYGFWDPEFYVELKDGGQTVGMIYLAQDKFKAGEKKKIDLRSWVDSLSVSDIVIWPTFNIFDQDEYMKVGE